VAVIVQAPLLPQTKNQKQTQNRSSRNAVTQALSLAQVEKLISIRTPDSLVAQEIQSRGISDIVTSAVVSRLRARGAGGETVAAVTKLIARSTLVVLTTAGADVILDGSHAGTAGLDGRLAIPGLDPGTHVVQIQKVNFRARSEAVQLPPNQTTSLDGILDWAVGFLTVSSNAEDVRIQYTGGAAQMGRITRAAVPPGAITVVASAPLRKQVSQDVIIEPGKEATISLLPPWDDIAIAKLKNQIHASFRSHEYQTVIREAGRYLQTNARDKDVLAEVAISNLEVEKYPEFRRTASAALDAGATLQFQMQHHHAGFRLGLHPALLAVTSHTLRFQPEGSCNFEAFETPLDQIGTENGLNTVIARSGNRSVYVVKLTLPNPSNAKKRITLNLAKEPDDLLKMNVIRDFFLGLTEKQRVR
jgi:hypothetical protein